jgi:2,3-bisphosphoglycerate-independent phosphoglycerate mutase
LKRINSGKPPANIIIPRGAGAVPKVQPFGKKYGLKPVCIAETGLIKGIAKIAGMELVDIEGATGGIDTNLENIKKGILETASKDFDFILINVDGADEAGHDGQMDEKVKFIEKVDTVIGEIMELEDVYFILTADHSTPISTMDHTGDPVPIVILGPEIRIDDVKYFNERSVAKGGLCRIRGNNIMDILMDLMNLSIKFGA